MYFSKAVMRFLIAVGVSEGVGILGALFTIGAVYDWYPALVKPALTPPAWVFGPVWTTLFFLMGIALYLMWQHPDDDDARALRIHRAGLWAFGMQLLLNFTWSFLFFGMHSIGGGLIDIILLLLAIITTTVFFFMSKGRTATYAGLLMLPYLAWVVFALYLNCGIWVLN